ncbi:uncharacterized protein TNCV_1521771 [Trichonephila clavipes]|nr:uncharacterized protein TNCV_1521771 [Trichonephila clavipes]
MFRSGGPSEAKPPVLSSQASLVLIYRPTEGMKGWRLPAWAGGYFKKRRRWVRQGSQLGVTVHFTQQPNREQPLSSQPKQKLFKTYHPDKAPKPRLPDPIIQPIAVMPPSRTKNPTFAIPLIEDLSRNGIEDCSYSPEAQKSNAYSREKGFLTPERTVE